MSLSGTFWLYLIIFMFIADAYKDDVTRKVTVCVRYVTRWPFKPGYTAPPPMFQLGSIPMNFRYFFCGLNVFIKGNWEISRRDPNNPCFIAMVTTEPNFVDPDYDEYAAFESRSLFCFHGSSDLTAYPSTTRINTFADQKIGR
ncbi:hypothetical protein CsSME_00042373 [Camellia sinensis var. sinensis]